LSVSHLCSVLDKRSAFQAGEDHHEIKSKGKASVKEPHNQQDCQYLSRSDFEVALLFLQPNDCKRWQCWNPSQTISTSQKEIEQAKHSETYVVKLIIKHPVTSATVPSYNKEANHIQVCPDAGHQVIWQCQKRSGIHIVSIFIYMAQAFSSHKQLQKASS